ncbi:MAG: nitroreductase family protein [Chloroflexi bacterium]|nr:nitroreductase family protein [Chloroflexota bacterium]
MNVSEAIRARRSIKEFSSVAVSREMLLALVDAARYSPSGANKNAWQFLVATEPDALARLGAVHAHCHWLGSARAAIAIIVDPLSTRYWLEDCCVAAYSIWLAAADSGFGVAWAAMYLSDNPDESKQRQALVREALNIPEKLNVPIVLGVGYAQNHPPARNLAPLDGIVRWDYYTPNSST